MMADGAAVERHVGDAARGSLSPLLANVFLDEVDKKLERRGRVRPVARSPSSSSRATRAIRSDTARASGSSDRAA